jgi:hypothetical protein
LLAVGAVGFGCSDSSEALTLEEYFAEFDPIGADFEADEELLADEVNLAPFKDLAAALPRIAGEWGDRLKALTRPPR